MYVHVVSTDPKVPSTDPKVHPHTLSQKRKNFGKITGWIADMPEFMPRRISTYSQAVLHQEINNVKGENGWWFWIHDQTLHDMYQKCDGTYII